MTALDEFTTDLEYARLLVTEQAGRIYFVKGLGWLYWNEEEGRWSEDLTGELDRRVKAVLEKALAKLTARNVGDSRKRAGHVVRLLTAKGIWGIKQLASSEAGVVARAEDFDRDPLLLAVANGTLDLRKTPRLRSPRRKDLITRLAPVEYDPDAACPIFKNVLRQVMAGNNLLIQFLQRLVGYCLTGLTQEQILIVFWGSGANGKSTLLRIIGEMLGDNAMQTGIETLLAKRTGTVPNDIARLRGARLVTATEADQGQRFSESLIKQLTGEDKVTARFFYKEYFDFVPTFKLVLATNHRPQIRGNDHAIWRRIRLVPFAVTIPDHQQDKHLVEKLRKELPGILAWAVRGCERWQTKGLRAPEEVVKATNEYRREMDVIGQFIANECELDAKFSVGAGVLYPGYKDWCVRSGEEAVTSTAFGRALTDREFRRGHGKKNRTTYVGIRLRGGE